MSGYMSYQQQSGIDKFLPLLSLLFSQKKEPKIGNSPGTELAKDAIKKATAGGAAGVGATQGLGAGLSTTAGAAGGGTTASTVLPELSYALPEQGAAAGTAGASTAAASIMPFAGPAAVLATIPIGQQIGKWMLGDKIKRPFSLGDVFSAKRQPMKTDLRDQFKLGDSGNISDTQKSAIQSLSSMGQLSTDFPDASKENGVNSVDHTVPWRFHLRIPQVFGPEAEERTLQDDNERNSILEDPSTALDYAAQNHSLSPEYLSKLKGLIGQASGATPDINAILQKTHNYLK